MGGYARQKPDLTVSVETVTPAEAQSLMTAFLRGEWPVDVPDTPQEIVLAPAEVLDDHMEGP
jgi:hypothetical protein